MSLEQNKQIVLSLFEEISKGNISGMLDLLAEDATWWFPGNIPQISGTKNKQEVSAIFNNFGLILPKGIKFIADHIMAEGDYVAVELHSYGETVKGKIYEQTYHYKFEVKGGKIRAAKEYTDTLYGQMLFE